MNDYFDLLQYIGCVQNKLLFITVAKDREHERRDWLDKCTVVPNKVK